MNVAGEEFPALVLCSGGVACSRILLLDVTMSFDGRAHYNKYVTIDLKNALAALKVCYLATSHILVYIKPVSLLCLE